MPAPSDPLSLLLAPSKYDPSSSSSTSTSTSNSNSNLVYLSMLGSIHEERKNSEKKNSLSRQEQEEEEEEEDNNNNNNDFGGGGLVMSRSETFEVRTRRPHNKQQKAEQGVNANEAAAQAAGGPEGYDSEISRRLTGTPPPEEDKFAEISGSSSGRPLVNRETEKTRRLTGTPPADEDKFAEVSSGPSGRRLVNRETESTKRLTGTPPPEEDKFAQVSGGSSGRPLVNKSSSSSSNQKRTRQVFVVGEEEQEQEEQEEGDGVASPSITTRAEHQVGADPETGEAIMGTERGGGAGGGSAPGRSDNSEEIDFEAEFEANEKKRQQEKQEEKKQWLEDNNTSLQSERDKLARDLNAARDLAAEKARDAYREEREKQRLWKELDEAKQRIAKLETSLETRSNIRSEQELRQDQQVEEIYSSSAKNIRRTPSAESDSASCRAQIELLESQQRSHYYQKQKQQQQQGQGQGQSSSTTTRYVPAPPSSSSSSSYTAQRPSSAPPKQLNYSNSQQKQQASSSHYTEIGNNFNNHDNNNAQRYLPASTFVSDTLSFFDGGANVPRGERPHSAITHGSSSSRAAAASSLPIQRSVEQQKTVREPYYVVGTGTGGGKSTSTYSAIPISKFYEGRIDGWSTSSSSSRSPSRLYQDQQQTQHSRPLSSSITRIMEDTEYRPVEGGATQSIYTSHSPKKSPEEEQEEEKEQHQVQQQDEDEEQRLKNKLASLTGSNKKQQMRVGIVYADHDALSHLPSGPRGTKSFLVAAPATVEEVRTQTAFSLQLGYHEVHIGFWDVDGVTPVFLSEDEALQKYLRDQPRVVPRVFAFCLSTINKSKKKQQEESSRYVQRITAGARPQSAPPTTTTTSKNATVSSSSSSYQQNHQQQNVSPPRPYSASTEPHHHSPSSYSYHHDILKAQQAHRSETIQVVSDESAERGLTVLPPETSPSSLRNEWRSNDIDNTRPISSYQNFPAPPTGSAATESGIHRNQHIPHQPTTKRPSSSAASGGYVASGCYSPMNRKRPSSATSATGASNESENNNNNNVNVSDPALSVIDIAKGGKLINQLLTFTGKVNEEAVDRVFWTLVKQSNHDNSDLSQNRLVLPHVLLNFLETHFDSFGDQKKFERVMGTSLWRSALAREEVAMVLLKIARE